MTSVSGRCVKEHSPAQEEDGSTDTSGVPECYSFCQSGLVALSTVQSTSTALVFSRLPSNYFTYTKGVLRKMTREINFCFIAAFCIIFLTFNHTVSCLESLFGAETVFMIFFVQYFAQLGYFIQNLLKFCYWHKPLTWYADSIDPYETNTYLLFLFCVLFLF